MKKINISDITLRINRTCAEAPLSFKEKLEVARSLDKMHADVIELAPIANEKTDVLLARTVLPFLKHSKLSIPVGADEASVDVAYSAVSGAQNARLQVRVPTSPVQMEYFCHKKPAAVLESIKTLVAKAAAFGVETEFVAEDATRSEMPFLASAIEAALEAGAKVITLCDDAGTMLPEEIGAFVDGVKAAVPALSGVTLGIQLSNAIDMVAANAVAAIKSGVDEIKLAAVAVDCLSTASFAKLLSARGIELDAECGVKATELKRLISQIEWIVDPEKGEKPQSAVSAHSTGVISLKADDDMPTVCKAVKMLGYELSEEDNAKVYEEFCRVAAKKNVGEAELDAIVASAALQVPPTFVLKSYVINSGNVITATAHIQLEKKGAVLEGISVGDGPIDAAFRAIEQIIGHHYELDDFQIKSVTEGREAMGSALVKLRSNGKLYSGNGISTDIIGASIRAYVAALNKIAYEENQI